MDTSNGADVQPKIEGRDTCLCIKHENMRLLVSAVNKENVIPDASVDELIASLCGTSAKEYCYVTL